MKECLLMLLLLVTGCVTSTHSSLGGSVPIRKLTLDQTMDILAQLHVGMPAAEAMAILQSNGLCEQPMIIGNRFSKGYFFHLSKRHQLCLDCRINTTAQGTNSIVDHIYIETRNEKDSLSIVEVTPQIERNTVFKFDLKPNNANQVPEDTARKLADPQH